MSSVALAHPVSCTGVISRFASIGCLSQLSIWYHSDPHLRCAGYVNELNNRKALHRVMFFFFPRRVVGAEAGTWPENPLKHPEFGQRFPGMLSSHLRGPPLAVTDLYVCLALCMGFPPFSPSTNQVPCRQGLTRMKPPVRDQEEVGWWRCGAPTRWNVEAACSSHVLRAPPSLGGLVAPGST